ncbi:hypothetical protein V8E36_007255 [Tilletia maclaganii]
MPSEDDGSSDSGDEEPERSVFVKAMSISGYGAGGTGKAEKPIAFAQCIYLRASTTLDDFLDMVFAIVAPDFADDVDAWRITLDGKTKGDPFKEGIELRLKAPSCASTYGHWLKDSVFIADAATGASSVKVYGLGKPKLLPLFTEESYAPLQHVDPLIASAADRIVKANHCNDPSCGQKSAAHPACWPKPGSTEHINLTESNILPWATALAAGAADIGERYPPAMPPFITSKVQQKRDDAGTSSAKGPFKRYRGDSSNLLNEESGPEKKKHKVRKEYTAEKGKENAIEVPDSSPPPEIKPTAGVTSHHLERSRGPWMLLDEFTASFGLPNDIRLKLEHFKISDSYVIAEISPLDYHEIGLELGEPLVLQSVIRRWSRNERVTHSGPQAGPEMMLHGFGDDIFMGNSNSPPAPFGQKQGSVANARSEMGTTRIGSAAANSESGAQEKVVEDVRRAWTSKRLEPAAGPSKNDGHGP